MRLDEQNITLMNLVVVLFQIFQRNHAVVGLIGEVKQRQVADQALQREVGDLKAFFNMMEGDLNVRAVVGAHRHIGDLVPDGIIIGKLHRFRSVAQIDVEVKVMLLAGDESLTQVNDVLLIHLFSLHSFFIVVISLYPHEKI